MIYRFGDFEVRPLERQLRRGGAPLFIGSRAFDVLQALLQNAGRIVSRTELIDLAWPGLVVEENNLSVQVATLRKLLGPQVITTVPGLGYQFSAALDSSDTAYRPQPLTTATSASSQPPTRRQGNLPAEMPALFGREADLAELASLTQRYRLVTVGGPGGIGKTRVAQSVALKRAKAHEAGACLVELAPVVDPSHLIPAVTQALGLSLPAQQPPLTELIDALADEDMLLVLDNCEHLVIAVGQLVQALFSGTRRLRFICTSQELLKLHEEHVLRLPPLSVPTSAEDGADRHGALQLLVARVQALDPRFTLDAHNLAGAIELCRRLDGLPLAIELAAARVPLLGLAGVCQLLDQRLRLLTGGARSHLPRHRTMRETLAWSHSLLSEEEAAAFRRIGVFAGSFSLQMAQQVLTGTDEDQWEALERLASLVDKSLVDVERGDPPRYRLLESARAYAVEQLAHAGETATIQRRHAEACLAAFEQAHSEEWQLPSQSRRRRWLLDLDNARAALEWAAFADPQLHAELSGAVAWLFRSAGHSAEGLRHCRRALEWSEAEQSARCRARLLQEYCQLDDGNDERLLEMAERAVAMWRAAGDREGLYMGLGRLAIVAATIGHPTRGDEAIAEMCTLWDTTWPPLARWNLLNARDYVANQFGKTMPARRAEAEALAEEQLALARAHGDTAKLLFALMATEQCVAARGRYDEAVVRGRELVALAEREHHVENLHVYLNNLATALAMAGDVDEALPLALRSTAMDARHGSLWKALDLMALIALRRGRLDDAARILGRSDAANAYRGGDREPVEENVHNVVLHALQAHFEPEALQRLREQGEALDDESATALALSAPEVPANPKARR